MTMQQETRSTSTAIDNLTYDLITVIQEKSKGLAAYETYIKDAQGNGKALQLFKQIQQHDQQEVKDLLQCLREVMQGSTS